jgi:hypothetical protein
MKHVLMAFAAATVLISTTVSAQDPAASATPAAAPSSASAAKPAAKLSYTDDYRINVNHDAESDGELLFQVTPKDGATQDVKVAIKKGTGENDVARAIKAAFVEQIGTKKYSIEMEDGENVIIETGAGNKNIALVLVSSTVKGVKVSVHWD